MRVFKVEKMMCGGCVAAVTKAIEALNGVEKVKVDLETKEARVEGDVDTDTILEALNAAGYPATPAD